MTLPRDTEARQLDGSARHQTGRVVIPAGTRLIYVETRYDAMRHEDVSHVLEVESGVAAGDWVSLDDWVGPGPLPWEV